MIYINYLKPLLDSITALIAIILLSPVFIVVSILLFCSNGYNVFFIQRRPGKNGKIFKILKFKTMSDRKDASGALLSDSDRLTKIGSVIRKLSLDELPQLFNVLKGDMSIVGPRPLLPSYLSLYNF